MLKYAVGETIFKLICGKDKNKFKKEIINFYNRYFPEESNILIANNSSVFFIAKKNKEIIGATRLITDNSRYALLLDLIVRKSERDKGIGKKILVLVKNYCNDQKIKHLILTTDPRYPWLTNFYKKSGFKIIKNQSLMEYST